MSAKYADISTKATYFRRISSVRFANMERLILNRSSKYSASRGISDLQLFKNPAEGSPKTRAFCGITYYLFVFTISSIYSHIRRTEEILMRSSAVWMSWISGPMDTQSRFGILAARIPHSRPAWIT